MMSQSAHAYPRRWMINAAVIALIGSSAAHAQQPPQTEAAQEATSDSALGDIIVTARRREESLQSVPVAVTALGAQALNDRGFGNVMQMEQVAPGLKFTTGGGGNSSAINAYIRGVGEADFIVTSDPAVALYIDGVYVARSFGADLTLNDIERVEVLRGPQGSLFGKNTIGGAINVVTNAPDGTPGFDADFRVGSFSSIRARARGDFVLGENLYAGVSALYRRAQGWQKVPGGGNNDLGNENAIAGRLQIRYNPAEKYDLLIAVDGRRQRQNGQPHNTIANKLSAPFAAFSAPFFGPCCEITADPDKFVAVSPYNNDDADAFNVTATGTIPLGTGTLKSITAYRYVNAFFGRGINSIRPNYYGDYHDERSRQFSQELQYADSFMDDRISLLAGLYYFRERSLDHTNLFVAPGLVTQPGFPAFLASIGLPAAAARSFDLNLDFDNRQTTRNYAAFGNVTVHVTDQLSIDLGGRYTIEKKKFYQRALRTTLNVPLIPQAPSYTLDDTWRAFTPKATISYQFTPDVMVYGTYSVGFRSGGFNGRPTQLAEIGSYEPERLNSFEAGLKSTLLDGNLRFNLSVFSNRYRNQQVQVNTIAADGITIIARVQNSGRSHMRGFEAETAVKLGPHVTLDGSLAYLDSGYDEYLSRGVDLSYLRLRNAPRWSGNVGGNFRMAVTSDIEATFRLDGSYKSSVEIDALNSPLIRTDPYWIANANLGFEWNSGWSLRFTAENFTDTREIIGGFDTSSAFGTVEAYYTPPARYYATVGYRF